MKSVKTIILSLLGVCFLSTIYSCSSSKIEGFENYQEACASQRFDVAQRFLARMDKHDDYNQYNNAVKYVFNEELLYLISLGDEQSNNRIMFLFKQYQDDINCIDEYYIKAIELASVTENEHLMGLIIDIYPSSYNEATIKSIFSLYKKCNPDKIGEFIDKNMSNQNVLEQGLVICCEMNNLNLIKKIITQNPQFITNELIVQYVSNLSGEEKTEVINTIKQLVNSKISTAENDISPRPALGIVRSDRNGDIDSKYNRYIYDIEIYNDLCLEFMTFAINMNDFSWANEICNRIKTNIVYNNLGDWDVVVTKSSNYSADKAYQVSIDRNDINNAKQVIANAHRK